MDTRTRQISWIASVAAAGLMTACGGGGGSSSGSASGAMQGTLNIAMTDAPACGFDAVNVTVSKVRVHQSATASESDAGWTDLNLSPARKINLLNLTNGALENLGQVPLPAGSYTQLRLVLDGNAGTGLANSVVVAGTTNEVSLDTPSAVQSGIKLINPFDVAAGQRVDVVLDFDACKSVLTKGNGKFALKPVVSVIPTVLNGIGGFVSPAANVTVSAQQNGVVMRATVPNPATGEFFLARMAPGNYDVVITGPGHPATVISGVPVASASSSVAISTGAMPISLPSVTAPERSISGTVLLPSTATEGAFVAAQQTFAGGPKVTLKYQGADLLTGAYTLSGLPTAAPVLGAYSPTLPIALASKTDTTPGTAKYQIEASSAGLSSKTVSAVDLTAANQVGVNFTLP